MYLIEIRTIAGNEDQCSKYYFSPLSRLRKLLKLHKFLNFIKIRIVRSTSYPRVQSFYDIAGCRSKGKYVNLAACISTVECKSVLSCTHIYSDLRKVRE